MSRFPQVEAREKGMCVHVSPRKTYWSEANPFRKWKYWPERRRTFFGSTREEFHLRNVSTSWLMIYADGVLGGSSEESCRRMHIRLDMHTRIIHSLAFIFSCIMPSINFIQYRLRLALMKARISFILRNILFVCLFTFRSHLFKRP